MNLVFPNSRYYRVASGSQHDVLKAFFAETDEAYKALDEIAVRYGAELKKCAMLGTKVIGMQFKEPPTDQKLWSPIKSSVSYGYYRPLRRTKEGKSISDALAKLCFPSPQDLAVRLGAQPFFRMGGQPYCATVGYCVKNGVYYLEAPYLSPINVTEGTTIITLTEWAEATKDLP